MTTGRQAEFTELYKGTVHPNPNDPAPRAVWSLTIQEVRGCQAGEGSDPQEESHDWSYMSQWASRRRAMLLSWEHDPDHHLSPQAKYWRLSLEEQVSTEVLEIYM